MYQGWPFQSTGSTHQRDGSGVDDITQAWDDSDSTINEQIIGYNKSDQIRMMQTLISMLTQIQIMEEAVVEQPARVKGVLMMMMMTMIGKCGQCMKTD